MEAAVLTSPSRTRLTGRGDIDDIRVVERVELEQRRECVCLDVEVDADLTSLRS